MKKTKVEIILTDDDQGLYSIYEFKHNRLAYDFKSHKKAKKYAKKSGWKVVDRELVLRNKLKTIQQDKLNLKRVHEEIVIKKRIDEIIEAFPDEEFLTADGFDSAIIGVDEITFRIINSIPKCILILINRDEMTEEEAIEYLYFNVVGSYVGVKTPIWCNDEF